MQSMMLFGSCNITYNGFLAAALSHLIDQHPELAKIILKSGWLPCILRMLNEVKGSTSLVCICMILADGYVRRPWRGYRNGHELPRSALHFVQGVSKGTQGHQRKRGNQSLKVSAITFLLTCSFFKYNWLQVLPI
jgi:hypothetical protein